MILDSPSGHGPYNVRGIGNAPVVLPTPAIANAIEDALGVRAREVPITAEKVHEALRTKGTQEPPVSSPRQPLFPERITYGAPDRARAPSASTSLVQLAQTPVPQRGRARGLGR